LLIATAPLAQSRPPDLSGLWQLAEPTAAERARDTLVITSPDQLLIADTPLEKIVITHPSKPGTHPETGSFAYGEGGIVGGIPRSGNSTEEKWGVTHIGTQLLISRSTTRLLDDRRVRMTLARGSMWQLEAPNRLVIEFSEERTGERPRVATRTYVRAAPTAPRIAPRAAVP
jgi:hypothetical protein